MNIKLEPGLGQRFETVFDEAKQIATKQKRVVEFEFNTILCLVNENTVLEWLFRDYTNAHIMGWKTVGPDCERQYDSDTEIELYGRKLERAKARKKSEEEYEQKCAAERSEVESMIQGIELAIIPEKIDEYKTYVEKNSNDGYSRAIIEYAETWGRLMQKEIAHGKELQAIADETQKHLGYLGITGFQYGCVVQTLGKFWTFGDALRKWHNKSYGVDEDKAGTVNPAILTISKREN